MANYVKVVD